MAAARVDRRLAAILAADVVGYSRLIERDEAGTLERLKEHRKSFIEPLIAEHHGRIVKLMGDGALCEFGSVVDAVACAIAIQRGMAERDTQIPEDQRIRFRIGINLGDVVSDEATSSAMASTSPRASSSWRGPAALSSPAPPTTTSRASSAAASRTSASSGSRTSRARCGRIR